MVQMALSIVAHDCTCIGGWVEREGEGGGERGREGGREGERDR